ncbi:pentatricopeptide repeat-containing protein At1g08070, chloroplastic-like [Mercurialis annua]|uniref:pentatricopeptide repeat-containing protein At1g08070, chloroplastic-like n=1 Tax=Mercurialis annua TaxID=3986 RepID=UPI002160D9CA|nr:pentatricopeptide repeat-containing protein At1g08070, chloroplastic-like [Mercurialis annua]
MNLTKQNYFSAATKFRTFFSSRPRINPTITLSILETLLNHHCKNFKQFSQILSQTIFTGLLNDNFAASKLLKFSTDANFIHINHSYKIFDTINNPNAFLFNTMMRAYVQTNVPSNSMGMYKLMLRENVEPDNFTYPILIQSCAIRVSEFEGKMIHCHVMQTGFEFDVYVKNTLINLYGVCGKLSYARKVFDESPVLDLVSWNSMLAGYVLVGDVEEAKCVYERMPERNVIASNSMIVLFGKKGDVDEAFRLFDGMPKRDLVSWSALISGYEQNERYEEGLVMFRDMIGYGIMVDEIVLVSVLSACANLVMIKIGKLVHSLAVKIGIESYVNLQNALIYMYSSCWEVESAQKLFGGGDCLDQISWNSMISGYLKCGEVEKAKALFDSMIDKDIISWSAMISGYVQHDRFAETLTLFQEMQVNGVKPDETTLVSVVSACTHLAALDQGKWVHVYVRKNGLKINVILGTTLIDMYMKFGCVENALEVFHGMEEKGVSTWNAVILGLALNGLVDKSLDTFSEMKEIGVMPNEITFVAVLVACRHMGLVEKGRCYFSSMIQEHKIDPNLKHYGCMVDLLGRAGLLKEAEELIQNMPITPDVSTWGALLGACKKFGDNDMGERVGRKLIELHPDHEGFHVLLSNIYASKGNWDGVREIRGIMIRHGVMKTPGCSMIEANGIVHEFLAGDKTHPQIKDIDNMLDEMAKKLKMEGYAPETHDVSFDIDDEEKETTLFRHSEKLAIAFGLISIEPPTPIRIMKNLRICNDCHMAAKLISRVFDREIVVRDNHRFHHFRRGSCTCMDYW